MFGRIDIALQAVAAENKASSRVPSSGGSEGLDLAAQYLGTCTRLCTDSGRNKQIFLTPKACFCVEALVKL